MAYFSLHAYDADVWIPQFKGLNQADIGLNPDVRFAAEEKNVETPLGVLQPQAAFAIMPGPNSESHRVETLASFYRRWYDGQGENRWYVCAAGGKLYQKQAHGADTWQQIDFPSGITSFQNDVWSWVNYEITEEDPDNPGEYITIDVMLISNADDGMFMIVPPERPQNWQDALSLTWENPDDDTWEDETSKKWVIRVVDTRSDPNDDDEPQKKFGVIERFAERIWGGAIADNPDMLAYSKPYFPATDPWVPDPDIPEDGAGDILQPTWDGDQFYALKQFGDQLLAFKKNHIWRVMGTNPGEFAFSEQYGQGTEFMNTIAVEGERVFMAGRDGVMIYDGMNTTLYAKEQTAGIWRTVNQQALDQMCAAMFQKRYYLAFPTGNSTVNNAMLVYDLNEGTILFYPDISVESFLPVDDALYATTSKMPSKILELKYDSWVTGKASGSATKWVSPWMDFGYKRIQKGGFDLYFLGEVQDEAVKLIFSVQTEKKLKTKEYTVQPLTEEQKAASKEHRMKRLHFSGTGRKFRVIIQTEDGVTAPWRLVGGLQLVVETDPD